MALLDEASISHEVRWGRGGARSNGVDPQAVCVPIFAAALSSNPSRARAEASLSAAELKAYRNAAIIMLELGDDQIEAEVEAGQLVEVKDDEQG